MPECYCKGDDRPTEMELVDAVQDYHDPADCYGHGQREFKVYVCPHDCGHTEPYENDDPEPYDD